MSARYEFRIFAALERDDAHRASLSSSMDAGDVESEDEVYLLLRGQVDRSVKLNRRCGLDAKTRIRCLKPLEQWQPEEPMPLPLNARARARLSRWAYPASLLHPAHAGSELVARAEHSPDVWVLHVHKQRCRYQRDDVLGEATRVWVNGAGLASLAVECSDPAQLRTVLGELSLNNSRNVSYPRMLNELCGLLPLPESDSRRVDV